MVFFSPSLFLTQPDWLLDGQRGVEISADFHYAPPITGWQVTMDLLAAGSTPEDYGHLYTGRGVLGRLDRSLFLGSSPPPTHPPGPSQ